MYLKLFILEYLVLIDQLWNLLDAALTLTCQKANLKNINLFFGQIHFFSLIKYLRKMKLRNWLLSLKYICFIDEIFPYLILNPLQFLMTVTTISNTRYSSVQSKTLISQACLAIAIKKKLFLENNSSFNKFEVPSRLTHFICTEELNIHIMNINHQL